MDTNVELQGTDCPSCGIIFALPMNYYNARTKDGKSFHCPNGHSLTFGKSQLDDAKTSLRNSETRLDEAERLISNQKGQITKLKKKVKEG